MSTAEANEWSEVLRRVSAWPSTMRIALAHNILDSLGPAEDPPRARKPRGLSAAEIQGLLHTDRPAPDDETVERWIDERTTEKYGR
jgi:hypothetical protein